VKISELQTEFILGAAKKEQFPNIGKPEAAFCGRSNVGKSSLLNSIVLRKNIARTSSTPGKTQQINFYNVEDKWVLADLPGFGYAAIGKKYREVWSELNWNYLQKQDCLKLVCVLIDSRHDPMATDLNIIEQLENLNKKYLIILTKCDKINKKAVAQRKQQLEDLTALCNNCIEVLPYSSVKLQGRDELLAIFKKYLIDE